MKSQEVEKEMNVQGSKSPNKIAKIFNGERIILSTRSLEN
jgi:hypothetical protein